MKSTDPIVPENPVSAAEGASDHPLSDRSFCSQRLNPLTWIRSLSWKRLRGSVLFILGYLLSPLCWWNDLIFNLPIAYGVGFLCGLGSSDWFLPGLIGGYWISNIIGIVMMQFGAIDALQTDSSPRNFKQDLLSGVISSTLYTGLILVLVQLNLINLPDVPALISDEGTLNLGALQPPIISGLKAIYE